MSCIPERWPQSAANVACFKPDGTLKWLRFWNPYSEATSLREMFAVVTNGHINVVYRDTSHNWYMSNLDTENGAAGLLHEDLSYNSSLYTNTIQPIRSDRSTILMGTWTGTGTSLKARLIEITTAGVLSTSDSAVVSEFPSSFGTMTITGNGELVFFYNGTSGSNLIVQSTIGESYRLDGFSADSSGKYHLATDYGGDKVYFMMQESGSNDWEWWVVDNSAGTCSLVAADKNFTAPIFTSNSSLTAAVAKVGSNRVWIWDVNTDTVELRKIDDDTGDVVLTVAASDFNAGGDSFDTLQLPSSRGGTPGYNIDSSGRFYCTAFKAVGISPAVLRSLGVSEANARRYSEIKDFNAGKGQGVREFPVVVANGEAVRLGGWESVESPISNALGIAIDRCEAFESLSYGTSTLEQEWGWTWGNDGAVGGVSISATDSSGNLVYYKDPDDGSGDYSQLERMLDVTRFA